MTLPRGVGECVIQAICFIVLLMLFDSLILCDFGDLETGHQYLKKAEAGGEEIALHSL